MPELDYAKASQCPVCPSGGFTLPEVSGQMDLMPLILAFIAGIVAARVFQW
jgi:hypothetical protein